jgi:RNA polymerase sigma-70 factor (ECF subfamily)
VDVLQGFIADKIIEQNLLDHAAEGKGKFRSFLLATLNNYLISERRSEFAAKRMPLGGVTGLDGTSQQLNAGHDPSEQFNIAWAKELIAEALRRMEVECARSHRPDLWTIFQGRVMRPSFENQPPIEYDRLVLQLGLEAPLQACHLLSTAKRMFARNLRAVAAEYAGLGNDADAEIEDLRNTLSLAGAQSPGSLRKYRQ